MTFADFLIHQQFRFEIGTGKIGYYVSLLSLGIAITTLLTVKGIFVPLWAIVPLAIVMVIGIVIFGYYLERKDVIARLNTHMNMANPLFLELVESVDRIEKKIDTLEKLK
jgi:phosphate/sulfate permease